MKGGYERGPVCGVKSQRIVFWNVGANTECAETEPRESSIESSPEKSVTNTISETAESRQGSLAAPSQMPAILDTGSETVDHEKAESSSPDIVVEAVSQKSASQSHTDSRSSSPLESTPEAESHKSDSDGENTTGLVPQPEKTPYPTEGDDEAEESGMLPTTPNTKISDLYLLTHCQSFTCVMCVNRQRRRDA